MERLLRFTSISSAKQPFFPCEGNMLVLQESCVDPLGAMIVYAPIDIQSVQMAVSGADSSGIPILPSGFIICSDGHPHTGANGASSSTSTANPMSSGSLLTVAFQILTGGDMQLVTGLNALVSSTIQNITSALNCTSLKWPASSFMCFCASARVFCRFLFHFVFL